LQLLWFPHTAIVVVVPQLKGIVEVVGVKVVGGTWSQAAGAGDRRATNRPCSSFTTPPNEAQ
jgi:hypothetical protein